MPTPSCRLLSLRLGTHPAQVLPHMTKKLNFQEGSWFEVPIDDERRVVGVVARISPIDPYILLGYFFNDAFPFSPSLDSLCGKSASGAAVALRFSGLSLIKRRWSVIGKCSNWDRSQWPTPSFVRRGLTPHDPTEFFYDLDDPLKLLGYRAMSLEDTRKLPPEGLHGDRAVEAYMRRLMVST